VTHDTSSEIDPCTHLVLPTQFPGSAFEVTPGSVTGVVTTRQHAPDSPGNFLPFDIQNRMNELVNALEPLRRCMSIGRIAVSRHTA
jgi:hypothetical protein